MFGYFITDPQNFGIVQFNENNEAISIEEKPIIPKSNYAVVGLYFFQIQLLKSQKMLSHQKEVS